MYIPLSLYFSFESYILIFLYRIIYSYNPLPKTQYNLIRELRIKMIVIGRFNLLVLIAICCLEDILCCFLHQNFRQPTIIRRLNKMESLILTAWLSKATNV